MTDKDTLVSSIKKLLSLNVADEEIIANLEEVGIKKEEAKILLKEAKVQSSIKEINEIKEEIKEKPKKEVKKEVIEEMNSIEKPEPKPLVKSKTKLHAGEKEVWEKGILSVVNERLDEIEGIRDNINETIDLKVKEELAQESKKVKVLLESERELLTEKINSSLDKKVKEFSSELEAKIDALKELKVSVSEESEEAELKEKVNEKVLAEIKTKLAEIETSKIGLAKALKNEMEEIKNESKQFMFDSTKQLEELDGRVNKALELESKITESLVNTAEKRVQEIALKETEKISLQLTKKLKLFEELTSKLNPKQTEENIKKLSADFEVKISNIIRQKETEIDEVLQEKIKEIEEIKRKAEQDSSAKKLEVQLNAKLEDFKRSLQNEIDESIQELENTKTELKKFIAVQLAESSENSEEKLNESFEERRKELESFQKKIIKNTNLKELNQKVEELDVFKKHFIETIKSNLDEMKNTKEELEVMVDEKEKEIDSRLAEIDSKINELDEFEKTFAKEMSIKINKLTKAKSLKQEVKEIEARTPAKTVPLKPTKGRIKKINSTKVSFKKGKRVKPSAIRGIR